MTSKKLTAKHLKPGQQAVTNIRSYKRKAEVIDLAFVRSTARINQQAARLLK